MKRTYTIDIGWVYDILEEIDGRPMTLQEIYESLKERGHDISLGDIRSIVSAFSLLGLIDRKKTWKKNYKYQIEKPEKP